VAYPLSFSSDFVEDRSRLTTFFRYLLAIPHFVVLAFYGFAVFFTVVAAWFAVVFTGRYPAGLYAFNAGALRYFTRVNAYLFLATDAYPPFGGGEALEYPVRLSIGAAQPEYDRMKALFRIILAIPVMVIGYALNIVTQVAAIISWFWIVITGRQNDGLHSAILLGLSYNARAAGYYFLMTESWPPFSDESALTAGAAPAGTLQQQTAAPPAAPEAPVAPPPAKVEGLPDPPPASSPPPPPPPPAPPSSGPPPGMTSGDPLG